MVADPPLRRLLKVDALCLVSTAVVSDETVSYLRVVRIIKFQVVM